MRKINYLFVYLKICILICIASQDVNAQAPQAYLTNLTVNGVAIPDCSTINFGNNSSINVIWKLTVTKGPYFQVSPTATFKIYRQTGSETPVFINGRIVNSDHFTDGTLFEAYYGHTLYASDFTNSGTRIYAVYEATESSKPETCNYQVVKPAFTLSTTNISLECNDMSSKTITASSANIPSGSTVTYNWSYPGWTLVGSNGNSRTFQPVSGATLPSTITVTPYLNGVAKPNLTCTTSRAPFTTTATLTGNNIFCVGGSSQYTLNNLEAGNTVTWSSSNTSIATVSNGTQGQVTLNGINQGYTNLIATITNPCGQTTTISKNSIAITTIPVFKEMYEIDPNSFYTVDPGNSTGCDAIGLAVDTFSPRTHILETQWQKVTQNVSWSRDYNTNNTNKIAIYPEFNINFEFKVRFRSICGWSNWIDLNYNITTCENDYTPPFDGIVGDNFIISPVPVTDNTLNVAINPQAPWFQNNNGGGTDPHLDPDPIDGGSGVPSTVVVNVYFYDQMGTEVLAFLNKTIPSPLDLNNLSAGTYIVLFEYQGQTESQTFVKN